MKHFLFVFNPQIALSEHVATFNRSGDAQTAARLFNQSLTSQGLQYEVVYAKTSRDAAAQAKKILTSKTAAQ